LEADIQALSSPETPALPFGPSLAPQDSPVLLVFCSASLPPDVSDSGLKLHLSWKVDLEISDERVDTNLSDDNEQVKQLIVMAHSVCHSVLVVGH
jgi:hypothetical protein